MRILIVGNGGREHALLWKLRRDDPDADFFATRPNAGMAGACEAVDLAPADVQGLAAWALGHGIHLTVVGPEAPLAAGLVDRFQEEGLPVFGPTRAAARIESSKAFAKELMAGAGIPTAEHRTFTDLAAAQEHIRERGAPIVVKASGLAAGKGALVCSTVEEALEAARQMLREERFGEAGEEIVVEEFMEGEELSVLALCDGRTALPLLASQDHKPVGEGDVGPNTGGMGAYAPVSLATTELLETVEVRVLGPAVRALEERGSPFRGLLYAGLMLTDQGPRVVEFNCRFGDPEAQVVLPLLETSLLELLHRVASGGGLEDVRPRWRDGAALTTVVASGGYPGSYDTGKPIRIPAELEDDPDVVLFHAGTRLEGDRVVTSGGRVLACTGLGESLSEAAERSRHAARSVIFEGKQFRSDIGWREFARDERARP